MKNKERPGFLIAMTMLASDEELTGMGTRWDWGEDLACTNSVDRRDTLQRIARQFGELPETKSDRTLGRMKMRSKHAGLLLLAFLLVGVSACASYGARPGPPVRRSSPEITIGGFYDGLAPYGSWVDVDAYGRVWVPNVVGVGWRPYTHGSWVYTSVGWTWISDWNWGWAPFHYGRWFQHGRHGWIWVPGTVWAPAWVAWRDGDGWLGWAPLPPSARWSFGIGLELGALDLSVAIASDWWIFVSDRYFLDTRLHSRIVDRGRNAALLRVTRDVTRYAPEGQRVVERSVPVERLERTLGEPVSRYRIDELREPPKGRASAVKRDKVKVYRPKVKQTRTKKSPGTKRRKPSSDDGKD